MRFRSQIVVTLVRNDNRSLCEVTVLSQNFADDLAVNVGQTEIAAAVAIRQQFVVNTQQVEHGRPEIVNGRDILHGVVTEFWVVSATNGNHVNLFKTRFQQTCQALPHAVYLPINVSTPSRPPINGHSDPPIL